MSAAADTAVLALLGIKKTFRLGRHLVPALQGVDLAVWRGELVVLTGPSGSGKSTLLNICGLIDRPDEGQVQLLGRSIGLLDEYEKTIIRRDSIGFIFQGFNLVPVMTVAENVDYPLFLIGVPASDRRKQVKALLEAVGLAEHAGHLPDELSGGQRQRVAIARALIKKPALVIADEPTASLDSVTAGQVLSLMREQCHQRGCAFLIATHDERLRTGCDRILKMKDGRLTP